MCPSLKDPEESRRLGKEWKAKVKHRKGVMYDKLTDYQKKAYADIPPQYQLVYLKAHTTGSRVCAIEAACNQCLGYEDLRRAIPECTSESCPLWTHRKGHK